MIKQENYKSAKEFLMKAIVIQENVLDKNSQSLLNSYIEISKVYQETGNTSKAEHFISKANSLVIP